MEHLSCCSGCFENCYSDPGEREASKMEVQTIGSLGRVPADQGRSLRQLQLPPFAFCGSRPCEDNGPQRCFLTPGKRESRGCSSAPSHKPQGCALTFSDNFLVFISLDTGLPDSKKLKSHSFPLRKTIRPALSNHQEGIFSSLAEV